MFWISFSFQREGRGMRKKIQIDKEKIGSICSYLALLLIPVVLFYMEAFFTYNPFERTRWRAQLLNILFLELVFVILFMITCRAVWALRIETAMVLVIGIANYYVISFRGNPIVPWDFLSLKTAASVAGEYDYGLGIKQILLILLFVVLFGLEGFVKIKLERKNWMKQLLAGAAALSVILGMTWVISQDNYVTKLQLYPFLFTPNVMYERNGFAVTFLMDLRYLSVEKPEGYSANEAKEILESYRDGYSWESAEENQGDTEKEKLPNILVIMNEAFSDVGVLGDFSVSEDYMPFVHSLQKGEDNTLTGTLHVSVKGGNTANTEFEFLTGQTMAFLPAGSIPYQQYVNGEIPSMASYLKGLGYRTIALHPYYASGWNRDRVYPFFGFEEFLDKDEFRMASLLRGYVDDMSCTDKLIELFENKEKGNPLFAFLVTMQNHSPYTDGYQFIDGNIGVNGDTHSPLSEYLTLVQKSDEALQALVEYFKEQEEPTVIVFFGDHQPADSVVSSIVKTVADEEGPRFVNEPRDETVSGTESEGAAEAKRYEVPYVIWANYDLKETKGGDTSANYLGAEVLEAAGVPLSDYQRYLLGLQEEYPAISTQRLLQADGSVGDKEAEEIEQYQKVQYYLLFDSKNQ